MSGFFNTIFNLSQMASHQPIKPLFTVKDGKALKEWLSNAVHSLCEQNAPFFRECSENIALFRGEVHHKPNAAAWRLNTDPGVLERARDSKLYVNKIHDLTQFWVNKLVESKPNVSVGPANTEHDDRIGAKIAKAVTDSLWYQHDISKIDRTAELYNVLAGEHYVAVLWNPDIGDLHPEYVKDKDKWKEKSDRPIRIGDVEYKHIPAWRLLPQPVNCWEDVDWVIFWEEVDKDVLLKEYPKAANDIKDLESVAIEVFNDEVTERLNIQNKTLKFTLWHRRTKWMPEGREICFLLDGTVLKDIDLPYQHDHLPLVRLTNISSPDTLRGFSWYRNVKPLQLLHYFLTSMITANNKLFSYPKWVAQSGSVDVKALGNGRTVIWVRGQKDPFVLQPNPTPAEVYKFLDKIEMDMDAMVKGQFGAPSALPARIDSAIALQYLDEKDSQRFNSDVAKRNQFLVDLAKLTLAVAGDYYDVEDGRLLRIVGKNQQHDIKFFDFANFNRPYDIRVEGASALPETRAARISTILEIAKTIPGAFSTEQLMDLIDLGSSEKMFDMGTKALRAAESIVEDLIQGRYVPSPEGYEDLITYWRVISTYIQDRQFKEDVPVEYKTGVLDYLRAIEMLMHEKGQINPVFAEQVAALPLFPLLFIPPPPLPVMDPALAETEAAMAATPPPEQPAPPPEPQLDEEVAASFDLMKETADPTPGQ